MNNLPMPIKNTHPIWEALKEIQQSRTAFQLENFVVGQHDTPEQKYRQTLLELQELLFALRKIDLETQKTLIEIERLENTEDPIDKLNAEIKKIDLEKTALARIGAIKEIEVLVDIWDSFEIKYTANDIEANQIKYWDLRLTRQAQLEALGNSGNVTWGSLDALRQIGKLGVSQENIVEETKEIQ